MKTTDYTRAIRATLTPAARLAQWQARSIGARLAAIRKYLAPGYPCGSVKIHGTPTLAKWRNALIHDPAFNGLPCLSDDGKTLYLDANHRAIDESIPGREHLKHRGWFTDEFRDETLETHAVSLRQFRNVYFGSYRESVSGMLVIDLTSPFPVDFSECSGEYDADNARRETARDCIRSHDSYTERVADDEREFRRKELLEYDIEQNRERLVEIRTSVRSLAKELRTLCPGSLPAQFPAAASAVRSSLAAMLRERETLIAENLKLAAQI